MSGWNLVFCLSVKKSSYTVYCLKVFVERVSFSDACLSRIPQNHGAFKCCLTCKFPMKNYGQTLLYYLWLDIKQIMFRTKYKAEFDVTDKCNLRCKNCYHFQSKDIKTQELQTSVWAKRFNRLYKSGIRAVLLVGGEPALKLDVLMLADKTFPLVHVITNGTIKIPKQFNHRLFVSIDGLPKTNNAIRGNGVFSRVIENYSQDKRVIINMTLRIDNYKELEDVIRIAEENLFDGVVCNICGVETDINSSLAVRKKERAAKITEMKRVKSLYPKRFLMTKAMIKNGMNIQTIETTVIGATIVFI